MKKLIKKDSYLVKEVKRLVRLADKATEYDVKVKSETKSGRAYWLLDAIAEMIGEHNYDETRKAKE